MATRSSILGKFCILENSMGRGAWWATVLGGQKELDVTEHTHSDAGRDWGQEEKGTTEDEMAGWHQRLDGREFE